MYICIYPAKDLDHSSLQPWSGLLPRALSSCSDHLYASFLWGSLGSSWHAPSWSFGNEPVCGWPCTIPSTLRSEIQNVGRLSIQLPCRSAMPASSPKSSWQHQDASSETSRNGRGWPVPRKHVVLPQMDWVPKTETPEGEMLPTRGFWSESAQRESRMGLLLHTGLRCKGDRCHGNLGENLHVPCALAHSWNSVPSHIWLTTANHQPRLSRKPTIARRLELGHPHLPHEPAPQ